MHSIYTDIVVVIEWEVDGWKEYKYSFYTSEIAVIPALPQRLNE